MRWRRSWGWREWGCGGRRWCLQQPPVSQHKAQVRPAKSKIWGLTSLGRGKIFVGAAGSACPVVTPYGEDGLSRQGFALLRNDMEGVRCGGFGTGNPSPTGSIGGAAVGGGACSNPLCPSTRHKFDQPNRRFGVSLPFQGGGFFGGAAGSACPVVTPYGCGGFGRTRGCSPTVLIGGAAVRAGYILPLHDVAGE